MGTFLSKRIYTPNLNNYNNYEGDLLCKVTKSLMRQYVLSELRFF